MSVLFYKTIFSFLKGFDINSIQGASADSTAMKRRTYARVEELISSGVFTKSEAEKFICSHYKLSGTQITELWNKTHTVNYKTSVKKAESTFRTQTRTLSAKVLYLLKFESVIAYSNFLVVAGNEQEEIAECNRIFSICDAFSYPDMDFKSDYSYTLRQYMYDYKTDRSYALSECVNELRLLKNMRQSNLIRLFDKCDKDKLAFLIEQLDKDLIEMKPVSKEESTLGISYCVP